MRKILDSYTYKTFIINEFTIVYQLDNLPNNTHLSIESQVNFHPIEKETEVLMGINIYNKDDDKLLIKLSTTSTFDGPTPKESETGKNEIVHEFLMIVFDTCRGVVLEKCANTRMRGLVLPILKVAAKEEPF